MSRSLSEALRAERVDQLVWAVCYESKVHKYAFFLYRTSDVAALPRREEQLAASKTLVISQLCAAAAPMAVRRREEGQHRRSRQTRRCSCNPGAGLWRAA